MGILMCLKSGIYFLVFPVLLTFSSNSINVFEYTAPSSNSDKLMFIQLRSSNENKIIMPSDHKLRNSSGVSSSKSKSNSWNGLTSSNEFQEDHKPPEVPKRTVSLIPGRDPYKKRSGKPDQSPPPLPPRDPSIFQSHKVLEKRVTEQLIVLDGILKEIESLGCVNIDSSEQNELPENDDVFD
ncbi:Uncharacterized protein GY17_00000992 [Cryptosporidium hominis]|uniref:Uncharacterized protein n=1 Tax=Cryptosporidium hominis TaxID=237895 RepID=A0ABX5BHK6_CRYHO|nr:hypothetical protein [Cryptosporidium hominis TU502]PPS97969.1 Uncharacterized protein GY17_00000992 [Cryptosporidium hominis]|eukprot:PPS97969.1 Uncharacterized protein GY17_00000992 [Cryptosporidium hominis]